MLKLNITTALLFACSLLHIGSIQAKDDQLKEWRSGIQHILSRDDALGSIRNNASEKQPLATAIAEYSDALKQLDYSTTPQIFKETFLRHIQAWDNSIKFFEQFGHLRGEMHDLFDQIRETNAELAIHEKAIWDTWRNVATVRDFYASKVAKTPFVFSSNKSGKSQLYRMTLGSEWKNLSNSDTSDNWPVLSPDKKSLVFQRKSGEHIALYKMNLQDLTTQRLLTHTDHTYLPSFNPTTGDLHFLRWETVDGERNNFFYQMSSDGIVKKWIDYSPNASTPISWSPKGNFFIATLRQDREAKEAQLHLFNTRTKNPQPITELDGYNGSAAFSNSGDYIAFYSANQQRSRVGLLKVSDRTIMWLNESGFYWYPVWSADDHWIVMSKAMNKEQTDIDLVVVHIDNPTFEIPLVSAPSREGKMIWLQ